MNRDSVLGWVHTTDFDTESACNSVSHSVKCGTAKMLHVTSLTWIGMGLIHVIMHLKSVWKPRLKLHLSVRVFFLNVAAHFDVN